jgi:hypothetical protein
MRLETSGGNNRGALPLPLAGRAIAHNQLQPCVDTVVASRDLSAGRPCERRDPSPLGLKREKRPLLKCRNESPRRRDERNCAHAGVPAFAGTTHGSVTYMKTPYAIALPATGRGELKLRTERFIVSLSQLAASHSSQRTRLSEAPYPSRRGSRSGNGSRPRCEHLQLLR